MKTAQAVVHGENVGLAGAAGERSHGEVDHVRAGGDGGPVAGDGHAGGVMRVELDFLGADAEFLVEDGAGGLDRVEHGLRRGGAGGVLEREAVERDAGLDDLVQAVFVELRGVRVGLVESGSQAHHGDGDLVLQAVRGDGAAGDVEVADVVQGVEVADRGDAVLLEHLRVELDDVGGLGGEADHVHAAGERLQVHVRTDRGAPLVHHLERVFLAVEIERLETGAAADFDVVDAGLHRRVEGGKEVIGFDTGAEAGLESVAEGAVHEFDFFHKGLPFMLSMNKCCLCSDVHFPAR